LRSVLLIAGVLGSWFALGVAFWAKAVDAAQVKITAASTCLIFMLLA